MKKQMQGKNLLQEKMKSKVRLLPDSLLKRRILEKQGNY